MCGFESIRHIQKSLRVILRIWKNREGRIIASVLCQGREFSLQPPGQRIEPEQTTIYSSQNTDGPIRPANVSFFVGQYRAKFWPHPIPARKSAKGSLADSQPTVIGTEIHLDSRTLATAVAASVNRLDRTTLRVNKYPRTNRPNRIITVAEYSASVIALQDKEADASCCICGNGCNGIAKELVSGGVTIAGSTRSGTDGNQELTAACAALQS